MKSNNTISNDEFLKLKRALQQFQSNRISSTHEDIQNEPEYSMLADFFFKKMYGPKDFEARDEGIRKLNRFMEGRLYTEILVSAKKALELQELSNDLDDQMVYKMIELDIGVDMAVDEYKSVYIGLDNYDERLYQINLAHEITIVIHTLSKKWYVRASLTAVKKAAGLLNMAPVIDFIYEGFIAVKRIKHIKPVADLLMERELAWHEDIWESAEKTGVGY